jgi:hypothetical protein
MDAISNAFDRIRQRIEIDARGCWVWQGAVTRDMYGQIKVGPKTMSTHRVAFLATNGAIARGKVIRHTCDNARCCNPAHLIVGDHEDNVQDIIDRGRAKARRVLTADELALVAKRRAEGATKRELAEALHCNWQLVSDAIDRLGVDFPRRAGRPRGSRNMSRRVTDAMKAEIKTAYAKGQHTQQQLSERFGCDQTYVSLIVRGKA